MTDANKEGKKMKNKMELKPRTLSLEEKNELAKNEEKELEKQIQDLKTWVIFLIKFISYFFPVFQSWCSFISNPFTGFLLRIEIFFFLGFIYFL